MRRATWGWVAGLAAASLLGWLPFLTRSLSPDEGGYLLVAAQWAPGSSLYGDQWVDRPPGLIAIFALAEWLGGPTPLRVIGALAVVAAVVLAALIGRAAAPEVPSAPVATAAVAAILAASPLFGGSVVDGEVLGLPFVLAGMAALVAAHASPSQARTLAWGLTAGVAAVLAVLVKQSLLDVFVMALALLVLRGRRLRPLAAFLVGAVATTAASLAVAARLGTSPVELWDALVTFRFEAAALLADSAGPATADRFTGMILALVGSVAPILVVALGWAARAGPAHEPGPGVPPDLRGPAFAVLAWELVVVVLGGSYWLHYLMGLVPGVVLLAAAAAQRARPLGRAVLACYAVAAVSTLSVLVWVGFNPIDRAEEPVIDYLAGEVQPGDTAVVAFGGANIPRELDLECRYIYLWSLPVRVRDPDLHSLTVVLAGPERPTWLVVSRTTLGAWGLSFTEPQAMLDAHYVVAADLGRYTVYRLQTGA